MVIAETCQCRRGERIFLFFFGILESFRWADTKQQVAKQKEYFSDVDKLPIAQWVSVDSESKETEVGLGNRGVNVESNETKNQNGIIEKNKTSESHQDLFKILPGVQDREWKEKNSRTEQKEKRNQGRSRDETLAISLRMPGLQRCCSLQNSSQVMNEVISARTQPRNRTHTDTS